MNKTNLEVNPIPSYIHVDGLELYVTYPGQDRSECIKCFKYAISCVCNISNNLYLLKL